MWLLSYEFWFTICYDIDLFGIGIHFDFSCYLNFNLLIRFNFHCFLLIHIIRRISFRDFVIDIDNINFQWLIFIGDNALI